MKNNTSKTLYLTQISMIAAILLVMKILGLGTVPIGPLNMSFLTVPVAIGSILLGPLAGLILGAFFGACSFWDALSGKSVMTGAFLQISPIQTFILCVGMRMLMGFCTGYVFLLTKKLDRGKTICHFIASLAAPLLNTFFFMGYIVLVFYHCDYIQNIAAAKGAANPFMFVILLVGFQGLVEAAVCAVVGGAVSKGVSAALKWG